MLGVSHPLSTLRAYLSAPGTARRTGPCLCDIVAPNGITATSNTSRSPDGRFTANHQASDGARCNRMG
jgi:hypothetical protein